MVDLLKNPIYPMLAISILGLANSLYHLYKINIKKILGSENRYPSLELSQYKMQRKWREIEQRNKKKYAYIFERRA